MKYLVTVESFDDIIEEEVIVNIEGEILRCFMPNGLAEGIKIGNQYYADIDVLVFDSIELKKLEEENVAIKCIDQTFAYYIYGKLNIDRSMVESTIKIFLDDDDLIEYGYCDGKYVELKIDRLNLEFIV